MIPLLCAEGGPIRKVKPFHTSSFVKPEVVLVPRGERKLKPHLIPQKFFLIKSTFQYAKQADFFGIIHTCVMCQFTHKTTLGRSLQCNVQFATSGRICNISAETQKQEAGVAKTALQNITFKPPCWGTDG